MWESSYAVKYDHVSDRTSVTGWGRGRSLRKKLGAALIVTIFVIGVFAVMIPVQAHFTLGDYTATYPYHKNDFDPHIPGLTGYLWPGSGQNAYQGNPGTLPPGSSPGYQSPWPQGHPPTAPQNWLQLEGHEYAPFGAILASEGDHANRGDLIFALNLTGTLDNLGLPTNLGWDYWFIAIPPEFGSIKQEQIVTTVTNSYTRIGIFTPSSFDRYAPGWTIVSVRGDRTSANGFNHAFFNFTNAGEWYYLRINGVTAPRVAGKYFFKMWMQGSGSSAADFQADMWVPTQNWPVLLVKGEIDPAIITGTIRYGGYNATLYGHPVQEAGVVWAKMTSRLDPYTGKTRPDLSLVDAKGYFNSTAQGHYEVEGLAPGIYDLYASIAGYPQTLIASKVQVLKGQSLHLDGYLNPGAVIHGDVYSKHQFGDQPWPRNEYIKIEIYSEPTIYHKIYAAKLATWSPLPCVAGGQASYASGEDAAACGDPRSDTNTVAFPWHEYPTANFGVSPGPDPQGVGPPQTWFVKGGTNKPFHFEFGEKGKYGGPKDLDGHVPQIFATWINGLTPGRYYARAWLAQYVQSALDGSTFQEYSFNITPQEWAGDITLPIDLRLSSWINKTVHFHNLAGTIQTDSINTGASFLYGGLEDQKGVLWSWNVTTLSTQALIQGHASIAFYGFNDTWIGENYGIPAGTYTPKVYALGYLQQTFENVAVTLSGNPVLISDHVYRGVGFNITIYSTDWERPRINRNWVWDGQEIDLAILRQPKLELVDTISDVINNLPSTITTYGLTQTSSASFVEMDGGGRNQNAWDGANEVYFGQEAEGQYVGGETNPGLTGADSIPFNIGGTSITWPTPTAIDSGQFNFRAYTYGYVQDKDFTVNAEKGQVANLKINLVVGVNITLDILFKTEQLITPTNFNMSVRVRFFNDVGKLVATWMSSEGVYTPKQGRAVGADGTAQFPFNGQFNFLPGGVTLLHVSTAGMPMILSANGKFFGDPVFTPAYKAGTEIDVVDFSYFPNFGILGFPDYTGGWTAEVDTVIWYRNSTAFQGTGLNPNYYPPQPGLLLGESYHNIPGHPKDAFGWTDTNALTKAFVGHRMTPNHLGPYGQQGVWSLNNAHLSGETSGVYELDLRGFISGVVLGFTWSDEFRTMSWVQVQAVGAAGTSVNRTFTSYTLDGVYESFLVPGTYTLTIKEWTSAGEGHFVKTTTITINEGQAARGLNFYVEESKIPIPEISRLGLVVLSALAVPLCLLRLRSRHSKFHDS